MPGLPGKHRKISEHFHMEARVGDICVGDDRSMYRI